MSRPASQPNRPHAVAAARGLLVCGALVAWLSPAVAQPQSACEPHAGSNTEPLANVLARLPQCEKNVDWLVSLGERLLQEGRFAEAAEHLERALLLQPTNLPAAFAYSVALAGTGDLVSALQLLAQITQRPDLPEPLRQQLTQAQQRMAQQQASGWSSPQPVGWQHRSSAGLRLGYDSNLLGAPRLSNLTLTLPGGDVSLPVEPANQPRPGAYQRADVRTEHTHTSTSGRRTELSAALLYRSSPAATSANTTQADLVLDTQPGLTATNLPLWATLSAATLHTQGGTRYQSLGLGSGLAWAQNQCSQRLGAEAQRRSLASNSVLSGHYAGLTASWGCQDMPGTATASQPQHWQISARLGADAPTDATRPGGRQNQLGLRATARWQHWLLDIDAQHTRDATGYSPILANNAVRRTSRLTLRAEHFTQLPSWGPGVHAVWGVEVYRQNANLELFKIHSINAYMAVRRQW